MDKRVTHLNGLPHLPGAAHLHVNRPLFQQRGRSIKLKVIISFAPSSYENTLFWPGPVKEFFTVFTKTQTKKISVILSVYFHVVLQQLNIFIYTDDRFERLIRCAFRGRLNFKAFDAQFTWRPEQLSCRLEMLPVFFSRFFYLVKLPLNFLVSFQRILNRWIHAFVAKFKNRYFCRFPASSKGHQHGVSIQGFISLGKTFFEYLAMKCRTALIFLARLFAYWSSSTS